MLSRIPPPYITPPGSDTTEDSDGDCWECSDLEPFPWSINGRMLCLRCAAFEGLEILGSDTVNDHVRGQCAQIVHTYVATRKRAQ